MKVVAQREIDISRPQTQKSLTSLSAKDAADSCESLLLQSGARTDGDGREMGVTFKQKVDWEDEPLEQGRVYRIRVVFTGSTVV